VKVFVLASGQRVPPFRDPMDEVQVLGRDLAVYRAEELDALGCALVASPPVDEPYLCVSDRTWFTRGAIRRFLDQAQAPARLQNTHPQWLKLNGALQDLEQPGLYEVALLPAGAEPGFEAPPVEVEFDFEEQEPPRGHPAMAHAMPETIPVSDAGIHQLDHWSHILRVNWLAMTCTIQREQRKFRGWGLLKHIWGVLWLLLKARSLNRYALAKALTSTGEDCDIHPTALVEASVLGDRVSVGPYAVVRGSVLGDDSVVGGKAIVNASVLGQGAKVERRGTAILCVLYPGAFLSPGWGHQASILGRQAFVAWSAMFYDLSFAAPIKVLHRGERVSTGQHFLGVAIGHGAKVGGRVELGYGSEVPNGALLVGSAQTVLRNWEEGEGPHRVEDGVARPVGRRLPRPISAEGSTDDTE
jgi:acetyltransferase-like isoleucine patch superfamily enzyme